MSHANIDQSGLNRGGLHLNPQGIQALFVCVVEYTSSCSIISMDAECASSPIVVRNVDTYN